MQTEVFLKNRLKRQLQWNGQDFVFIRYKTDEYNQITEEIENEFPVRGVFHDGGGYGGMLNIEIYEREGARTVTKMKPMILCMYEQGKQLQMDDTVIIAENIYKVVGKNNIKNLNIAFELSLELQDGR